MRILLSFLAMILFTYSSVAQLVINEFVASNVNGIVDEDNEYSDWIEIYNAGSATLELENYSLSDDILLSNKWTFPAVNLQPSKHLTVFASGKDRKELALTYQTIIDWGDDWQYLLPESDPGETWKYQEFDDTGWSAGSSGFGYGDDDDSTIVGTTISVFARKEFTLADIGSLERLILHVDYDDGFIAFINGVEVARANLPNGDIAFDQPASNFDHEAIMYTGGAPTFFEVNDPQNVLVEGINIIAIQVHNVSLTSSDLSLIPFLTIGRSGAGQSPVNSDFVSFPSGNLHTNFKIGMKGESIYLFDPMGMFVDSVQATALYTDVSYGRQPDGGSSWYFFGESTPGTSNNTVGISTLTVDTVSFSPSGGNYSGGLSLSLASQEPGSEIYYTLDGSIPTSGNSLYSSSIPISGNTVVRARAISDGNMPGPVITNTYISEIDHDFPIVCISTNPENLWDQENGIYVLGPNPGSGGDSPPYPTANYWQDWEKPVHVELYDRQGDKQIDQGAGVKIFGGWSRTLSDQRSMSLFARSKYGKGSFKYKIFREKSLDKFESIVLRNSGNDNNLLQFQDGFITGLASGMDVDKQAFEPAVVYLNGAYWGILNIREKVNEHFIADNNNVKPSSINLLELDGIVIQGDSSDYMEITDYLTTNVSLQTSSRYDWISQRVDIDNFIRYQLTQIYVNNRDWPGNNIKFWNTTNEGSKFRWILYDTDFGFGIWNVSDYGSNTLDFALQTNGPSWPNPPYSTLLFRRMVTNIDFRHNFINQYCDRLNTNFTAERISHHLDSLQTDYQSEIQHHFNRWSGSYGNWMGEIEERKTFGELRPHYARLHMKSKFNLGNELTVKLDVSDQQAGTIQLNSIIPNEYPFDGIYFTDVPIKLTAIPKPGYKFVNWEGGNTTSSISIDYDMSKAGNFKAVFAVAGFDDISIIINEINYNSSAEKDTKDWIELYNSGLSTVNLENWLISDTGPDSGYFIPTGTLLAAGEFLIIGRDLKEFRNFHPYVKAIGDLPFGLSSQGDILRLYDDSGTLMDAVDYFVDSPWPEQANGTGATLELRNPALDNTMGENWKALTHSGTPGRSNLEEVTNGIQFNQGLSAELEAFPNPFSDFTTIQFEVSESGEYKLEVFDINGRVLDLLVQEFLEPGQYYIDWGISSSNELSEGVYTIRLSTHNTVETIKLIKL